MLETIYITRHGHRLGWQVDHITGKYTSTHRTPTGNPVDPPLASHGVKQSHELAAHFLEILPRDKEEVLVYASPFYRCLQTIAPTIASLQNGGWRGSVRGETGLGEWFGSAPFPHPPPSPASALVGFFPFLSTVYKPHVTPASYGESIDELHDRLALALQSIITQVDAESGPSAPRTLIICGHAAPIIASGRVLTGQMPEDPSVEDFGCHTAGLSKFVRREGPAAAAGEGGELGRARQWRTNGGVGGGWDCVLNSDCSFLSGGEERGWHFNGDESYSFNVHIRAPDFGGRESSKL